MPKDDSFEFGQLKNKDKQKIPLATPKPIILRPRFLDSEADDDTLDLMKTLRTLLRDESFVAARGSFATLIYVDDEEFPGAIRPTGRYTVCPRRRFRVCVVYAGRNEKRRRGQSPCRRTPKTSD